jgi:hypothetical protein
MSTVPEGTFTKLGAIAAVVGVLVAVAAAIHWGSSSSPSTPSQPDTVISQGTPTPDAEPDSNASSPGPVSSPSSPPSMPSSPSAAPRPSPIVTPQIQSGYTVVWHGTLAIGLPGVIFTRSGAPQPGDGTTHDLQYQGSGGGWNPNGPFYYWTSSATPGPASCEAIAYASNAVSVENNVTAYVGDKYCFLPPEGGMVLYMQVTKIEASGVVVLATWQWSQNSWGG